MILIMLLLLWLILQLVTTQMGNLTQNWEGISTAVNGRIRIFLGDCCMFAEEHFGVNAAQAERSMLERMEVLVEEVRVEFLPRLMTESFWYVKKLVSAAAFLGITLIASILLCKDFDGLMERVQGLLESTGCMQPNEERKRINILDRIFRLAAVFLKTQGILMLTVAGISSVGLLVGNITNAVILGLLSGLLDTLPFIGTGIVLIPTALWQLLCGRYTAAVWCIFVYILCVTVRELLAGITRSIPAGPSCTSSPRMPSAAFRGTSVQGGMGEVSQFQILVMRWAYTGSCGAMRLSKCPISQYAVSSRICQVSSVNRISSVPSSKRTKAVRKKPPCPLDWSKSLAGVIRTCASKERSPQSRPGISASVRVTSVA
jgi:hypothetical protein